MDEAPEDDGAIEDAMDEEPLDDGGAIEDAIEDAMDEEPLDDGAMADEGAMAEPAAEGADAAGAAELELLELVEEPEAAGVLLLLQPARARLKATATVTASV